MTSLLEFIEAALAKRLETIVLIHDRTHYIFTDGDIISEGWALLFDVVEVISETHNSVIAKIEYIDKD